MIQKSDNVFANVDSLLFMVGKNVDDVQYSKSHSLQVLLVFGCVTNFILWVCTV